MTGLLVSLKEAAAISGLSLAGLKAGIQRGHFPAPIEPYRKIHVASLCAAIDKLAGYTPNNVPQDEYDFEALLGKGFYSDETSIGKRKNREKAPVRRENPNLLLPQPHETADLRRAE